LVRGSWLRVEGPPRGPGALIRRAGLAALTWPRGLAALTLAALARAALALAALAGSRRPGRAGRVAQIRAALAGAAVARAALLASLAAPRRAGARRDGSRWVAMGSDGPRNDGRPPRGPAVLMVSGPDVPLACGRRTGGRHRRARHSFWAESTAREGAGPRPGRGATSVAS